MSFPNSQSNPAGAIPVWIAPPPGATQKNIGANASTLVYTGPGVFTGLSVNTAGTGSTAKVYDGTDDGGILLGTFATTAQGPINLPNGGLNFTTGLFVVTAGSGAADITVQYIAG